jgi:hypothetical protein
VVGCQPYAPAVFTPRNILVLILKSWVNPRHMELSDAMEKIPSDISGINPGTFWLVAYCVNHYATPGPLYTCSLQKTENKHFSFDRIACDSRWKKVTLSTHFKQKPNGCHSVTPQSHVPPFQFTQGMITSNLPSLYLAPHIKMWQNMFLHVHTAVCQSNAITVHEQHY